MNEISYEILVKARFSGGISETSSYLGIMLQTALVVFGGIVIWRASIIFQRKKDKERHRTDFFETNFSRNWKRKR